MLKPLALAAAIAVGGLLSQPASAAPLGAAGLIEAPATVEQAQIYFGIGPGYGGGGYYAPRRYYGGPRAYYGRPYYGRRAYAPRRFYGRPVYRRRYYY